MVSVYIHVFIQVLWFNTATMYIIQMFIYIRSSCTCHLSSGYIGNRQIGWFVRAECNMCAYVHKYVCMYVRIYVCMYFICVQYYL